MSDSESSIATQAQRPLSKEESAVFSSTNEISSLERSRCSEFFQGRGSKTPERYTLIRNHILDQWQRTKPAYLTKIRARNGLRNCGDVNAIGRVHAFLEAAGAINQGAQPLRGVRKPQQPRPPRHAALRSDNDDDGEQGLLTDDSAEEEPWPSPRPRRRSQQQQQGGHVIAHVVERRGDGDGDGDYRCPSSSDTEQQQRKRRKHDHPWQPLNGGEFRLIPCLEFAQQQQPPPFALTITAGALALMDLHAHLTYSEVIGLLGGTQAAGAIHVDVAFACAGAGSATECEMDAAAEVAARQVFARAGRCAVGWFHSHPAFEPTPSVRDVATQRAYQALCRLPDGSEPFVGAIVSPPGGCGAYGVSDITVFCVPRDSPHQPFNLPYSVAQADRLDSALLDEMAALVRGQAARLMERRADLAKRFRRSEATTALEKLLISMRSHWHPDVRQMWDDEVSLRLRPLLLDLFCASAKKNLPAAADEQN
ncbi:hypothetical protein LPJ66_001558 [Kickxella alabastrina]|uniref:Uncharacterized protein n=1 Tax=Kickxella alabastrina TaxID=61397 RepID=A0ACC1ISY8_9FUNG|nr:hypothetical protein LPJ66_001558 [Kickxella alabastrina]